MFSVVIPLYNKEVSIVNTIDSVLNQTFYDFEIVIVNDGSTDNSVKVINSFNDNRIRIIHQENQGVSTARNKGIKEAKFEWIALLDADDLWKSNHLETLDKMINKYPNDKVFTTSHINSNEIETENQKDTIEIIDNYFKEAIRRTITNSSTICINKQVLVNLGGFLVEFNRGEDLELWNRIGRHYRFVKSNVVTAVYSQDSENKITKSKYNFNKSTLLTVHMRFDKYVNKEEKFFYIYNAMRVIRVSLLNKRFKDAVKMSYRLFLLLTKKIESND